MMEVLKQKQKLFENAQKCLLLCFLAISAALFFKIDSVGIGSLVFSGAFVYLALRLLPVIFATAVLCCAVAGLALAGQTWQLLLVSFAEFVVLMLLLHRNIQLVIAVSGFWLLAGAPALWLLYQMGNPVTQDTGFILVIHATLNALLNAGIASAMLLVVPNSLQNDVFATRNSSLSANIFAICSTLITLPVIIIGLNFAGNSTVENLKLAKTTLASSGVAVARESERFISERASIVLQQANLISLNIADDSVLQSLSLSMDQYPEFIRFYATDSEGNVVFVRENEAMNNNNRAERSIAQVGYNLGDSPIFLQPMQSKSIHFGYIDPLESHGDVPLLTISVPVFSGAVFAGVVAGIIDVQAIKSISRQIQTLARDNQLVVTNKDGIILMSSSPQLLAGQNSFIPLATASFANKIIPLTQISEVNYYYQREINAYEWRVYSLVPATQFLTVIEWIYLKLATVLVALLASFFLLSFYLSSRISQPLTRFLANKAEAANADQSFIANTIEFVDVQDKLTQSRVLVDNFEQRVQQQVNERTSKLEENNLKLAELGNVDALTQLMNQRGFEAHASTTIKANYRMGQPFTFAILNIDRFAAINDSYGRAFADKCLRAFAALLKRNCKRETDFVGRYEADTFTILLSGEDIEMQHKLLRNIHQQTIGMQHKVVGSKQTVNFTVSIGICSVLGNTDLPMNEIISLAKKEMHQCKQQGRNRVSIVTVGYHQKRA